MVAHPPGRRAKRLVFGRARYAEVRAYRRHPPQGDGRRCTPGRCCRGRVAVVELAVVGQLLRAAGRHLRIRAVAVGTERRPVVRGRIARDLLLPGGLGTQARDRRRGPARPGNGHRARCRRGGRRDRAGADLRRHQLARPGRHAWLGHSHRHRHRLRGGGARGHRVASAERASPVPARPSPWSTISSRSSSSPSSTRRASRCCRSCSPSFRSRSTRSWRRSTASSFA